MSSLWSDNVPIYIQLAAKMKQGILDGSYPEDTPLPSVRAVSASMSINHLTVAKSYHELVDQGLIEKRRGLGMFVKIGAVAELTQQERELFLNQELPEFIKRMQQLGVTTERVIKAINQTVKDD